MLLKYAAECRGLARTKGCQQCVLSEYNVPELLICNATLSSNSLIWDTTVAFFTGVDTSNMSKVGAPCRSRTCARAHVEVCACICVCMCTCFVCLLVLKYMHEFLDVSAIHACVQLSAFVWVHKFMFIPMSPCRWMMHGYFQQQSLSRALQL